MLRRAAEYLPALPELNAIRTWTGFRPASHDGLPLIGPAAHFAQGGPGTLPAWLAIGHEGLGVTTALGTARLLAAQMLSLPLPLDPAPYLPTRFAASPAVAGARHA
jgi:glycine/D-amino acid oxidase-like deaminating enzyme